MTQKRDDFVKNVNELWQNAIEQLEDVKEAVLRSRDRIENRVELDVQRLRLERDRLLILLGEQTYKLANQGQLPVPEVVKRTVHRLNEVIDAMVPVTRHPKTPAPGTASQAVSSSAKTTKKTARKPAAAKTSVKQTSSAAKKTTTSKKKAVSKKTATKKTPVKKSSAPRPKSA